MCALTGQVWAQTEPPRTLVPQTDSLKIIETEKQATLPENSIRSASLDQIGYDSIGINRQLYFTPQAPYWGKTKPEVIFALLDLFPEHYSSAIIRQFATDILLFPAPTQDIDGLVPNSLLTTRLEKLYELGKTTEINQLFAQTTGILDTPSLAQIWINTQILSGDTSDFCDLVKLHNQETLSPYWQRLSIYCYLEAGDLPKADLSLQLLYETDKEADIFAQLIDPLFGNKAYKQPPIDQIKNATEFLILKATNADLSKLKLPKNPALQRALIELFPSHSTEQLIYLHQLAIDGNISSAELLEYWVNYPEEKIDLDHLLQLPKSKTSAHDLAALYTAIQVEPQNSIKAQLVAKFIQVAPLEGSYKTLTADLVDLIQPSQATVKYSPYYIIALSLTPSNKDQIRRWSQLAQASDLVAPEQKTIIKLLALMRSNLPFNNSLTYQSLSETLPLIEQKSSCTALKLSDLFRKIGFNIVPKISKDQIFKNYRSNIIHNTSCDIFAKSFTQRLNNNVYLAESIKEKRFLEAAHLIVLLENLKFPEKKSATKLSETIIAMYELRQHKAANELIIEMLAPLFIQIIQTP